MSQADYIAKICLVGASGSGKSSLMMTYDGEPFNQESLSTIGVDFKIKYVTGKQGEKIMLQINDTAGQERFESISSSYLRGASGVLLVFDMTDEESLYKCDRWMQNVQKLAPRNTPVILIGNKCDLKTKRVVQHDQAKEMAGKLEVDEYFETSAKTGENVKQVFDSSLNLILARQTFTPKLKEGSRGHVFLGEIADPHVSTSNTGRRGIFKLLGCNIL
mmetsp:Transcript_10714/g.40121  ORF Transcript_10714/g.40121 Transcript_10714/m.40121 type:complete len:218 (-) Transcript_10714:224-877(-)|eukprot:CAMPEP_0117451380 /NCGR_PEP_ID=MMETSP0759-20121206/8976_1 /TAXON_ID=63605 /ORGANISM="Percolomonas cosmopolitus, Strain WS" /LENGTH=217 /DNA_ID=CAMNT_0005243975 /DNA_START=55 /DNA_END=708 /DNA_ORIENTATION=+